MSPQTAPATPPSYDYELCPQGLLIRKNSRNFNHDFLFSLVSNRLKSLDKMKILEVGTGGGGNLKALHDAFGDRVALYGTDISETSIRHARSLNIGEFRVSGAEIIPFEESFDLILMIDVLEHLDSRECVSETLREARSHLTAAGGIYISVPIELNRFCLTWVFSKFPFLRGLTREFYGHTLQFTPGEFLRIANEAGMSVIDRFYAVHTLTQLHVLFFFYLPKVLVKVLLGERASMSVRDSSEVLADQTSGLSLVKSVFLSLGRPTSFLGYWESGWRRHSSLAAGVMNLLLTEASPDPS